MPKYLTWRIEVMKATCFFIAVLFLVSGVFAQPQTPPWLKNFYGGVLYTASMDTTTLNKGVVGHDASLWTGAVAEWTAGPGVLHAKVFGYDGFKSNFFYQLETRGTTLRAGYLVGTNAFWFRPNPVSDQNHFLPPSIGGIPTLLGLGVVASNDLFSLSWHYGGDSSVFDGGLQQKIFGATVRVGGFATTRGNFGGAFFRIISQHLNATILTKREDGVKTQTGTLVVSTHGIDPYGFMINRDRKCESWEVGVTKTIMGCSWSPYIGVTIGPAYNWFMGKGGSLCFFVQIFFYK